MGDSIAENEKARTDDEVVRAGQLLDELTWAGFASFQVFVELI